MENLEAKIIYEDDKPENRETAESCFREFPEYKFDVYSTIEGGIKAIESFVQMGMIPPEIAQQMSMQIMAQSQQATGQGEGRPPVQDPAAIVNKSMPGADSNQITAQNQAAFKQSGTPKGMQGVK